MAVISGVEIIRRIFDETSPSKRIVLTPLLNKSDQIQEGSTSVDIRLGTHFLVQRRSNIAYVDPSKEGTTGLRIEERIVVPMGKFMVLHPNQFALGSSLAGC